MFSLCLFFWVYIPRCSLSGMEQRVIFHYRCVISEPTVIFLSLRLTRASSTILHSGFISVHLHHQCFLRQLGFSQPKLYLNSVSSKIFSLILYSTKFNFECFQISYYNSINLLLKYYLWDKVVWIGILSLQPNGYAYEHFKFSEPWFIHLWNLYNKCKGCICKILSTCMAYNRYLINDSYYHCYGLPRWR